MKNSDMEFGESKSRQVWETPSRSTLVKPKSAGLSRGPSLTFTDQGPKVIARKPPSSGKNYYIDGQNTQLIFFA